MLADEGNGPEEKGEKQEGQCHKNKPADFDRAREDGRLDPGLNSLHHDTCAAIGESAGGCIAAADGRSLTIVQQSGEARILETNFVLS
jgi:hypothetical protein